MRIPINKDLEEDYKDQLFAGYSTVEMAWIALAAVMIFGAAYIMYTYFSLPLETCAYVGVPFGAPAIFLGFKKFQGLTIWQYIKELDYERKTRLLLYDADELPDTYYVFAMKKKKKGWKNDRKGKIFKKG